jgi:two-component system phosphate regulon sensor histidine kinase PhoR
MKKSIFFKVFAGFIVLLLLLSLVFILFSFRTIRHHYLDTLARDLEKIGRTVDSRVLDLLAGGKAADLEAYLQELGKEISTRLTVINPDGVVAADSERDPATMENHRFRPEIQVALQGRTGRALRFSSTVKEDMLYVAMPIWRNGRVEGIFRLSLFVPAIDSLLADLRADIGQAVGLLAAFSVLFAFLFSRYLTRPLGQLIKASRRLAAGDFDAVVRLRRMDEWRDLAQSFNSMTAELKTLFADLGRRREELNHIIASMEEGLLVLDGGGKIILANAGARKLVGQEALEGRFFWEVVRMTPFVELVRRVKEERRGQTAEFTSGDKNILCRASYLPVQDGVVATLQDISEVHKLNRMKKDFVLNMSHELRTPLTAIRGYAETLEQEVGGEQRVYVETILRHTERLIKIVEDLLALSTLEERSPSLEREAVDLRALAETVFKVFEPKARAKNLALRLNAEDFLLVIQGDPFLLEQMIINLIDNAVKYTEKGSIELSLRKTETGVAIEIADTGIGIPEEDQDRVFERFYVVDKSRSRKLGGTGLGLSIVKHIVLQHGGKIDLHSTPGVGSRFRIDLPSTT